MNRDEQYNILRQLVDNVDRENPDPQQKALVNVAINLLEDLHQQIGGIYYQLQRLADLAERNSI